MKVIANNKKARFNYELEKTYECGISLTGNEIKSVRDGKITLDETYVRFDRDGNLNVINMFIKQYESAHIVSKLDERRQRRLLLHKKELKKINQLQKEQGYTIIPTKAYFKGNILKLEIALARGKKLHDKRNTLKERDIKRNIDKELKRR